MKRSETQSKDPAVPRAAHLSGKLAAAVASLPNGGRYAVGVSGGRDSVALLDALVRLGFKQLTVLHFDHRLRGRASTADARYVKALSLRLGCAFVTEGADVRSFAREKKLSIETAARQLRYEFFTRAAKAAKCRMLLLAHHADDQVETFLFNLFRGTGLKGLTSMQPVSVRGGLKIVRPLLGVWRAEIDEYVRAHRLRFREDATNADLENTRAKLRHRIIPWLSEECGRDIRQTVWRTAEIASTEEAWLSAVLPDFGAELHVSELRALPLALQRRLVHAWLKSRAVAQIGFDDVERVLSLISPGAPYAKANLPGARHVRRRAGRLFIEP